METASSGEVLTQARIENGFDIKSREQGILPPDQVVDTAGGRLIANPEHGGQHITDVF
jgi:hypothetical protein